MTMQIICLQEIEHIVAKLYLIDRMSVREIGSKVNLRERSIRKILDTIFRKRAQV